MSRICSTRDNLPRLIHRLDVMRRTERDHRKKYQKLFMCDTLAQDAAITYWAYTAVLLLIAECAPSMEGYVNAALNGDRTIALSQSQLDRRQSKRDRKRLEKEARKIAA